MGPGWGTPGLKKNKSLLQVLANLLFTFDALREATPLSFCLSYMPGALKESSPQTNLNRLLGPIQIYQVGISDLISSLAGLPGKIQDFQLSLKFRLVRNEFLPKPKNICSNWDTLIFKFNRASLLFVLFCFPGWLFFSVWQFASQGTVITFED